MSQAGLLRAKELTTQAQSYLARGWSVIPLVPGLKTPAIEWKDYQARRATDTDLRQWFNRWIRHGLAVVTGRVSSLIVVDFDEVSLLTQFLTRHPHLVNTYIVHTRRGFHLYYQVDPAIMPASRRVPGLDIQADGCYVVAPPSRVAGHDYVRVGEYEPLQLAQAELDTLLDFADSLKTPALPEILVELPRSMTPNNAVAYYRALLTSHGRNDALFKAALKARDDGQSESWTLNALAEIHVNTSASKGHHIESGRQRRREASATIASAYSRPPARPAKPQTSSEDTQLSTAVKQRLNGLRLTAVVRVIHALREHGIKPGDTFYYAQAAQMVKSDKIGDWSVRKALHAFVSGSQPIFEALEIPLSPPTPPVGNNSVASNSRSQYGKNAFILGSQNQQKVKPRPNHRPPILYRMPGNTELLQKLGIEGVSSRVADPIRADDLASAKRTRIACHREFVKRFPQQNSGKAHTLRFLARRIGVSVQTLIRYNHDLGVPVSPNFDETPLHWANLSVLDDTQPYGNFLVNSLGEKFPPIKQIAMNQLQAQAHVSLFRQRPNTYRYEALDDTPPGYSLPGRDPGKKPPIHPSMRGQPEPPAPAAKPAYTPPRLYARAIDAPKAVESPVPLPAPTPLPAPHKRGWYCKECLDIHFGLSEPEKCRHCQNPTWEILPESIWGDVENFKGWWQKIYRQHRRVTRKNNALTLRPQRVISGKQRYFNALPDAQAESLAQSVHQAISDLSLANIREIVATTDADLVRLALKTILERHNIRSRAGFFLAFIRSEKKFGKNWSHPK